MTTKTAVLIGCAGATVLAVGAVGLVTAFFFHVIEDPEGLWLAVDVPDRVRVGETFDLVVNATNRRSDRAIALGQLDVTDAYLAGFSIASVTPSPKSTEIDTFNDCTTMRFDLTLPPGESTEIRLELVAQEPGRFRGQIDQFVGLQYLSAVIQTTVTSGDDGAAPDDAVP